MAADGCYMPRSLDWDAGDGPTLGEVVSQPEDGFEQVEAMETIQVAIHQLSPRERRLIYLRFFEEQTQAEIAREFGVTQMQISRLLRRVLDRMRARLAPEGVTPGSSRCRRPRRNGPSGLGAA
jgi:RNA polymerase sigma-B factor